jgi:hypothetical protein
MSKKYDKNERLNAMKAMITNDMIAWGMLLSG